MIPAKWYKASWLVVAISMLLSEMVDAHLEDPKNCSAMQARLDRVPEDHWKITYVGISEDKRDFIIRFSLAGGSLKLEQHHILLPASQWKDGVPAYSPQILSEWLDWDGDGVYSEWYLFPRGETDCKDAIHFVWNETQQVYQLYTNGKEQV